MASVSDGTINIIDTKTGLLKITFSTGAKAFRGTNLIAFSPSEKKLFVDEGYNGVHDILVISTDTDQEISKISTPQIPWGLTIDESTHLLYVPFPELNEVAVIDIDNYNILGYIQVGACPFAVRLDTTRHLGFTSNMVSNSVSVFDLNQIYKDIKKN